MAELGVLLLIGIGPAIGPSRLPVRTSPDCHPCYLPGHMSYHDFDPSPRLRCRAVFGCQNERERARSTADLTQRHSQPGSASTSCRLGVMSSGHCVPQWCHAEFINDAPKRRGEMRL